MIAAEGEREGRVGGSGLAVSGFGEGGPGFEIRVGI